MNDSASFPPDFSISLYCIVTSPKNFLYIDFKLKNVLPPPPRVTDILYLKLYDGLDIVL